MYRRKNQFDWFKVLFWAGFAATFIVIVAGLFILSVTILEVGNHPEAFGEWFGKIVKAFNEAKK